MRNKLHQWLLASALLYCCALSAEAQKQRPQNTQESPRLMPILSPESKKGWHRFTESVKLDLKNPVQFFKDHAEAFELEDGYGMTLVKHTREDNLNMDHFRFQQTYKGIPVVGAEYMLHYRPNDKGSELKGNGTIVRRFMMGATPAISPDAALKAALAQINAKKYAWESPEHEAMIKAREKDPKATLYPKPKLVYCSVSDDPADPSSYRLAYEVKVFALEPMSHQAFFISAENGNVIKTISLIHDVNTPATGVTRYNGVQSFTTDFDGTQYVLKETNRAGTGTAISTYDMNNGNNIGAAVNYQNNTTDWQNEAVGVQGHWGAEKSFDYFHSVHGRNSFDNSGSEIIIYMDLGVNVNNAFWNGEYLIFGHGDGATYTSWGALDVVGHEFTHGVTEYSAGLMYQYESGALNESFSDIFGAMVEFSVLGGGGDWLVSEDVTVNGSGIRSMANPNTHGDPDTYGGTFWQTGPADYGGVHTNSGVQNFWFYLLSQGGTGTNDNGDNYGVTGIGRDAAAAIAYRNLTTYLNSISEYEDAREGALEAAEDLFGRSSFEYTQTALAWYAVGVGLPVYGADDLALRTVNFTGGSCDQILLDLLNASTTNAIPAGAIVNVMVSENGVPKPVEQVVLPSAIAPGASLAVVLSQSVVSTAGKVDVNVSIQYAPDPEQGNNSRTASIYRGTLTVGGANPDFPTVAAAAQAMMNEYVVICGNLVFKIRSGVYPHEVYLANIRASNAQHTITFESESGNPDDVILSTQTTINTVYGTLNIQNSGYIRIRNLTVTRNSLSALTGVGLSVKGRLEDIIIEGCKFRNFGSGNFRSNIEFFPEGQRQNRITIRNNVFEVGNFGIDTQGGAGMTENVLIENNRFTTSSGGIRNFSGGLSLIVRSNQITSANTAFIAGVQAGARQFLFEDNEIQFNSTSTDGYGLQIMPDASATVQVINNTISIKSPGWSQGIYCGAVSRAEILHNSIRQEKTTAGAFSATISIIFVSETTQTVVLNNILQNFVMSGAAVSLRAGAQNEVNHNNFHVPNGVIGRRSEVIFQTLQQWQAATGYDLNSLNIQPSFVSDTDLHLATQQLSLKAGKVTPVFTDLDGETRTLPPYIGADEYRFVADVGVVGIGLTDQVGVCLGTHVQIDVRNFHAMEGLPAGTQIPVSFRINDGEPVRETLTLQNHLLAGQTVTYTFNFVSYFTASATITARTGFAGDLNPLNDEFTFSVMFRSAVTIGSDGADFATVQEAIEFIVSGQAVFCEQIIILDMYPGTFPDPVTIEDYASLPPTASMVIQSSTRNKADVIISADKNPAIMLIGAKRVTFRDITIQHHGYSEGDAAFSLQYECEDIRIENCDLLMPPSEGVRHLINIKSDGKPTHLVRLEIYNSIFNGGGISLDDGNEESSSDEIVIKGNTVQNFYGDALTMRNAGNVSITENILSSPNPSGGIRAVQAREQLSIEMNRINLSFASEAISIESGMESHAAVSLINNFVDLGFGSPSAAGIVLNGVEGEVLHNTIRVKDAGQPVPSDAAILKNYGSSVNIRSNILYSTLEGMSATLISQAGNSTQDFNDIFVPNGYAGINADEKGSMYKTLEEWRYYTGFDENSTDVQPVFSGKDLHLGYDDPLLRPDGIPEPYVATDIDGEQRNFPPCIGADEFVEGEKDSKDSSAPALSVYPNPVEGDFTKLYGEVAAPGAYYIAIIDMYGVIHVKQKTFVEDKELSAEIEVKYLEAGIYILQLSGSGNVQTIRFERR